MNRPKGWNRKQWFSFPRKDRRTLSAMNVSPEEYWGAVIHDAQERFERKEQEMVKMLTAGLYGPSA